MPYRPAMAFDFQVTIDCAAPHELADWWAEALGWQVEPQDEAFIRRMVESGHASEADTTTPPRRAGVEGRARPDLPRPGPAAGAVPGGAGGEDGQEPACTSTCAWARSAARTRSPGWSALGATELWRGAQGPYEWVTLADPEGNEFCVT